MLQRQQPSSRRAFFALLLAICIGATACVDGYPTEDAPYLDVYSLSPEGKVQALNLLGQTSEPERRFALLASCHLQVEEKSGFWQWERSSISLSDAQILLSTLTEGKNRYELVLAGTGARNSVLLNGADPLDAHRAQLLMRLLQKDCITSD